MSDVHPIKPEEAPGLPVAMTRRLGPYAIVRPLGHGGMASVYEGVHIGLGKRVAIKVMQPHLASNETTSARFVREGRAVAKVRHPHVVDVFDVGSHEGMPYLVMELLEGVDLAGYLKRVPRLSLEETLDIMLPVISAVAAAHEAGIVHRDLKPANVFLAKGRHGKVSPKVVDFGISTFTEKAGDLELTHTQTMLGTVRYMSPEQTRGAKFADARSDQYSLGVMLYLCTTGEAPFTGEGVYETIHAIRNAPLVPPSERNPELPAAFDEILARAMSREPAGRYAHVAELGRALVPLARQKSSASWERELGAEIDLAATTPEEPGANPEDGTAMTSAHATGAEVERTTRRRRALVASIVVAAAGVAIALALVSTRTSEKPSAATASPVEPTASGAVPSSTATTATAIAPTAPPSAPHSLGPAVSPPTAVAGGSAPSAVATPSTTSQASSSAAHPKAPPARTWHATPTRPATGTNGAPILE